MGMIILCHTSSGIILDVMPVPEALDNTFRLQAPIQRIRDLPTSNLQAFYAKHLHLYVVTMPEALVFLPIPAPKNFT